MNKQLLQRALDALENHSGNYKLNNTEALAHNKLEEDLRTAIDAPEVAPVGHIYTINGTQHCTIEKELPDCALYTSPPDTEALRAELERVKGEMDAMRQHLILVKDCLMQANEQVNGPICDTIWYSKSETLFDYIDAAIAAQGG